MSIKRRLERAEQRFENKQASPVVYSGLALEIREIDADIRRLTAEMEEARAGMTPEELARERAELEEFDASMDGLSLDEQIEALKDEVTRRETEGEVGGGRNETKASDT